jgi:hypothetical protein
MARHKIAVSHGGTAAQRESPDLFAEPPSAAAPINPALVDEADREILGTVERYLKDGRCLKTWYEKAFAEGSFAQRFDLARTENRPDQGFGFFDSIEIQGKSKCVMGNYQEMFFDQPGLFIKDFDEARKAEWRNQLREFVLHYFMRVSSFSEPTGHIGSGHPDPSGYLAGLSWCQSAAHQQQGFGFSQLYCKKRDTGEILKFPAHERHAIIDLRELVSQYEWVLLRVEIFDFELRLEPLGTAGPAMVANLAEASYLVLAPDFVIDESLGESDESRYGFGYAFIRNPKPGFAAYGPGEFDAAFESIEFVVGPTGTITARMSFVSNRPEQVTNLGVNPVEWAYAFANAASLGWVGRVLPNVKETLPAFRMGSFDPVNTYISLANMFTAGQAADALCISRDHLDKRFLLQHFTQHYQTMVGSLMTWRQIPDWLDANALPTWVVTGGLLDG